MDTHQGDCTCCLRNTGLKSRVRLGMSEGPGGGSAPPCGGLGSEVVGQHRNSWEKKDKGALTGNCLKAASDGSCPSLEGQAFEVAEMWAGA